MLAAAVPAKNTTRLFYRPFEPPDGQPVFLLSLLWLPDGDGSVTRGEGWLRREKMDSSPCPESADPTWLLSWPLSFHTQNGTSGVHYPAAPDRRRRNPIFSLLSTLRIRLSSKERSSPAMRHMPSCSRRWPFAYVNFYIVSTSCPLSCLPPPAYLFSRVHNGSRSNFHPVKNFYFSDRMKQQSGLPWTAEKGRTVHLSWRS